MNEPGEEWVVFIIVIVVCLFTAGEVGYLIYLFDKILKIPTPQSKMDGQVLGALEDAAGLKEIVAKDLIVTLAEQRSEFKRMVQLMDQLSGRVDKVSAIATRTEEASGVAAEDRAVVAMNLAEASIVLEKVASNLRLQMEQADIAAIPGATPGAVADAGAKTPPSTVKRRTPKKRVS